MISKAPDVDTYMKELPAERHVPIGKIRKLCKQQLRGYDECIEYGMPAYRRNGAVEVAFASQKQYIAVYVLKKDVLDEFRNALAAAKIGKGCVRFTKPEKIDFDVVKQLLSRTAESHSAPC